MHEPDEKLCFRKTGDVVRISRDGSGPYIVANKYRALTPTGSSGLFEQGVTHALLVSLEDGVATEIHLSTRVVHYPKAAVHLGAPTK